MILAAKVHDIMPDMKFVLMMSAEYETSGKCISEKLHQNKKQGYWLLSTVHEYSRREKESQ
jgi:hypothetical protein